MPIQSLNPTTELVEKTFSALTASEIQEKIATAGLAFASWKNASFAVRVGLMANLSQLLKDNAEKLARSMAVEMGKPITAGEAEIRKCATVVDFYATNAENYLKNEAVATDATESFVSFEPLGVILAVMPWNFPFWQVIRFAAPAIMAGNVAILKHASNVPQCALAIEELFLQAGFPEGVFQSLLIGGEQVEAVIKNDLVKAVTLTGSEYAGSQVAMQSGKEIKKTVLELGGSDPFIVLADADLAEASSVGIMARLQNAGQSCIASKRFIVVASVYDEFLAKFIDNWKKISVGDPLDRKTEMGPIYSQSGLEAIEKQIRDSVAGGAMIAVGGKRMAGVGCFLEPTILTNVRKGMPAYDEEIFGPVAGVIKVENTEEAIAVANDTKFGLGASLWTRDIAEAKKIIPRLEAGCVFVNSMVKSDPRLPFGGLKKSGYGRELSYFGLREFVNIKTVFIK
ncbi:MAG: NAD-dependent succinate-semialdehyde dehydrogenase [Patescibacteria group bacterium]